MLSYNCPRGTEKEMVLPPLQAAERSIIMAIEKFCTKCVKKLITPDR